MIRILFDTIRLMWRYRKDFNGYGIGIFEWRTRGNLCWFKKFEFLYPEDNGDLEFYNESDLLP